MSDKIITQYFSPEFANLKIEVARLKMNSRVDLERMSCNMSSSQSRDGVHPDFRISGL